MEECVIGTCLLSDHADLFITVSQPSPQPTSLNWDLNPSFLKNPAFVSFMKTQIELFFSIDDNEDTSPSTSLLKGVIISYSTARKKEVLKEQLNSGKQLFDLDKQIKNSPSAAQTT